VRHLAGMGNEAYTIDYALSADHKRFEKRTTMEGDDWIDMVPVRNHDTINRDAASGLFAFLPSAPGCMNRRVLSYDGVANTQPPPGSSANAPPNQPMVTPGAVKVADNVDCEESLFANPGLLGFGMPALWEAQGEREYVFFTPIGPTNQPRNSVAVGIPGGGQPYGPGSVSQPGFGSASSRDPLNTARTVTPRSGTYHEIETVKFVERVGVRIGSRTREAWLMQLSNDVGPIYVDDDGRVLRIDLPARGDGPQRFLRMLWPTEY
jgi:hypothetical protein